MGAHHLSRLIVGYCDVGLFAMVLAEAAGMGYLEEIQADPLETTGKRVQST